jgi:hypothetical protein
MRNAAGPKIERASRDLLWVTKPEVASLLDHHFGAGQKAAGTNMTSAGRLSICRPGMRAGSGYLRIVRSPTPGQRLMRLAARRVELVKRSALAALPNQFASCGIKAVTLPRWSASMSSADSPLSVISFALVWIRRKG